MTSDELAARCVHATARALTAQNVPADTAHRVLQAVRDGVVGDGAAQYETVVDGEPVQAFEGKTPVQVVDDMLEEARDLINYAVMLTVRLTALRDTAAEVDDADTRPACPHCGARWDDVDPLRFNCPACLKDVA